ncbi:MAG: GNAT family N-acetyltransferase [Nakamurella sp.]
MTARFGAVAGGNRVTIRPAVPADDAALSEITARAYLLGGHLRGADDSYLPELRDVAGRREQAAVLVGEIGGVPRGSVTIAEPGSALGEYVRPGEIEIRMLTVDPAVGGRGVGSALLAAAIEHGRTGGVRRVVLHTLDSMTTAHRMYERSGFVREPEHDDEPLPGVMLRAYALALTDGAGD